MHIATIQAIEDAKTGTVSKEAFEAHRQQLATREDLYKVESVLQKDLAKLKGELETKIEQNSLKLVQWVVGLIIAQTGIIIALLKLFPHS